MADMTMGQRIAEERKKLGLSQEALGDKMGVSRQAISKWEADGAVPEIDKLIGLSKLFGVSVGWLLGTEVQTKTETEQETLSEKQLQMVEELMKRYQPKPRKKWPAALAAGVCALLFGALFLQTRNLRAESAGISEAISALRVQISTLGQTLEAAQAEENKLLERYGLEVASVSADAAGTPRAELHFSAIPISWQEGDKAYLSVLNREGYTVEQECTKDGAFLTAAVSVDVVDGYTLCLTIAHADGSQDQQPLSSPDTVERLKTALSVTAEGRVAEVFYGNQNLLLMDCAFTLQMPSVGMDYGEAAWERAELILCLADGQREIMRYNLLLYEEKEKEVRLSPSIVTSIPTITFENVELPENAGIQLWIWAKLDNGLEVTNMVMDGSLDGAGNLMPRR